MSVFEILTLCLSALAILIIPFSIMLVRGAIKWTRIEGKIDAANEKIDRTQTELAHFVADKERAHTLIYEQMKDDREATNRRLRWLEEHLWKGSGNAV